MAEARGVPGSSVPLADALHMLRLTGVLYCRADAGAPWGVDFPQLESHMSVPVVLSGRCILEVAGERHVLEAGSAALIPRGTPHVLASAEGVPAEPLFDLPFEQVGERFERMRIGGDGARTQIAYAALCADDALTQRLAAELPAVIIVDAAEDEEFGSFRSVLRLMAREAATDQLGGDTVLARLADVLVVQVLRRWLTGAEAPTTGWLAALSDPHVGRALSRMHADPAQEWTLVALAREARMSRSTFADRFTSLIGEPPMRYLAGWRLQQAHSELTRTDAPIGVVAARVGYASEAAFSRAFKRRHGTTPGEARRALRVDNARALAPV